MVITRASTPRQRRSSSSPSPPSHRSPSPSPSKTKGSTKPGSTTSKPPPTYTTDPSAEDVFFHHFQGQSYRTLLGLIAVVLVTFGTIPETFTPEIITLQHVFYYGWITALSTGLGVVPIIFCPDLSPYYIGVANAIACGMMTAASWSLAYEGVTFRDPLDLSETPAYQRTMLGALLGLLFIRVTQLFLDNNEEVSLSAFEGANAKKVLLILLVMTLHSFSEGVGIGVSFGGEGGKTLGIFISASLAVHNIPEGLAVAVALLSQRTTNLTTFLFCVCTSIPQPIMAIPAFLFVEHFVPVLPVGLGFAGGAMFYVAVFELWEEAVEAVKDKRMVGLVAAIAASVMLWTQTLIKGE